MSSRQKFHRELSLPVALLWLLGIIAFGGVVFVQVGLITREHGDIATTIRQFEAIARLQRNASSAVAALSTMDAVSQRKDQNAAIAPAMDPLKASLREVDALGPPYAGVVTDKNLAELEVTSLSYLLAQQTSNDAWRSARP
jgi:hypothetical protein